MTTRAPSSTSRRTVSRPIPPVEPVTTQTRSLRPRSTAASLDACDRAPPRTARRDRLEPRAALPGPRRPAAERHRTRAGPRARRELAGEPIELVYTSDLSRARETAEIVAARTRRGRRRAARAARDRRRRMARAHVARDRAAIPRRRAPVARAGPRLGVGRNVRQLGERVVAALRRIAAEHPAQRVLVVGHGGTIRASGRSSRACPCRKAAPGAARSATARCSESSQRTAPSGG